MLSTARSLVAAAAAALALVLAGCAAEPPPAPVPAADGSAAPSATPALTPETASPTARAGRPTPARSARSAPEPPDWVGDERNAVAFAPLQDPTDVTVEGRVDSAEAWSTSKVLVVAAFLDTVVSGDPDRLTRAQRQLVERSLSRSDGDATAELRAAIPGSPGRAMTAVLRSVGDRRTTAPDRYEGLMTWSVREQVRFVTALAAGDVVSPAASGYLLEAMRPIEAHAWGLGSIGASAYKGGWLREDRVTRQLGVVDGYAVAIITDGVGPAVVQTDGDAAHVRQMNRLAAQLEQRLAAERAAR